MNKDLFELNAEEAEFYWTGAWLGTEKTESVVKLLPAKALTLQIRDLAQRTYLAICELRVTNGQLYYDLALNTLSIACIELTRTKHHERIHFHSTSDLKPYALANGFLHSLNLAQVLIEQKFPQTEKGR